MRQARQLAAVPQGQTAAIAQTAPTGRLTEETLGACAAIGDGARLLLARGSEDRRRQVERA